MEPVSVLGGQVGGDAAQLVTEAAMLSSVIAGCMAMFTWENAKRVMETQLGLKTQTNHTRLSIIQPRSCRKPILMAFNTPI